MCLYMIHIMWLHIFIMVRRAPYFFLAFLDVAFISLLLLSKMLKTTNLPERANLARDHSMLVKAG